MKDKKIPQSLNSKSRGRRTKKRRAKALKIKLRSGAAITIVVLLLLAIVGPVIAGGILVSSLPEVELTELPPIQTSIVYDRDGNVIARLHGEQDRYVVPVGKMPEDLLEAVIAIEDARYYEHNGVDYIGVLRALAIDIAEGRVAQGGSTITMQYAKEAFLTSEQTWIRKIRQAMVALELERKYSKDQIIEFYLNRIYLGSGAYGVEAAARTYFGKSAEDLALHEAALIAGLIQRPGEVSPFINPEASLGRRNVVLDRMEELAFTSPDAIAAAKALPLSVKDFRGNDDTPVPFFIDYVKNEISNEFGPAAIFQSGFRIYTTIDQDLQKHARYSIDSILDRSGDPTAAIASMEVETGYIRAMTGGKDYENNKFNLATQGKRQPGSAFKPFVLATALNEKMSIYSTFSAPGSIRLNYFGTKWKVSNYSNKGMGRISLATAMIKSTNTVFAQLILKVGPKDVVKMANDLGIESKINSDPAIALGGLERGVSPMEMANAYSTFARRGEAVKPIAITKITDADGNIIREYTAERKRVMAQADADAMNAVLQSVVKSGTGTRAYIGRAVAGKTGTTQSYRDAWFIGYTPQLTTAVWVGHAKAAVEMRNVHGRRVSGGSFPAMIWSRYMRTAAAEFPVASFARSPVGGKATKVTLEGELVEGDSGDGEASTTTTVAPTTSTTSGTTTTSSPPPPQTTTTMPPTTTTTVPPTTTTTVPPATTTTTLAP